MHRSTLFGLILHFVFLAGCTTSPTIDPKDLAPAPQMAKDLADKLANEVNPSYCKIMSCDYLISDANHYVCTGEFSLMTYSTAEEHFRTAAQSILSEKMKIDINAEESIGSKMLSSFFHGMGAGLAAAGSGRGSTRAQR